MKRIKHENRCEQEIKSTFNDENLFKIILNASSISAFPFFQSLFSSHLILCHTAMKIPLLKTFWLMSVNFFSLWLQKTSTTATTMAQKKNEGGWFHIHYKNNKKKREQKKDTEIEAFVNPLKSFKLFFSKLDLCL